MTDGCLDNPGNRRDHRCPYYDHDIFSCDKQECRYHDPWAPARTSNNQRDEEIDT